MPGVAFPPVGPVGDGSPPSPGRCSAKTASLPIATHFAGRSRPDTVPASVRAWCPRRARERVEAPRPRLGLWSPGPQSGRVTRSQTALPRSRAPPRDVCPALSPRWCPAHSPERTQDCCLPVSGHRRLSPHTTLSVLLLSTTIHLSGLQHAASILALSSFVRPLLGVHVAFAPDLLARLESGGT
jgi:hypothetical protein